MKVKLYSKTSEWGRDSINRGDIMNMNYLYCDERQRRVSKQVCEHNFKTGACSKDLFKCQRARDAAKVEGKETPKIVNVETKSVKEKRPTLQHDSQLSLF